MAVGGNYEESIKKVQSGITQIEIWTKKWKIKLNESKSVHVDFTNRNLNYKHLYINNNIIPHENSAKYLGMTLDAKLHWKVHVKKRERNWV